MEGFLPHQVIHLQEDFFKEVIIDLWHFGAGHFGKGSVYPFHSRNRRVVDCPAVKEAFCNEQVDLIAGQDTDVISVCSVVMLEEGCHELGYAIPGEVSLAKRPLKDIKPDCS